MKRLIAGVLFFSCPVLSRSFAWGANDGTAALSMPSDKNGPVAVAAPATTPPAADSSDSVLEQGKTLYDNGQYVAALDKFMRVLRHDPHNPEAREYLSKVVDQMRAQKQASRDRAAAAPAAGIPRAPVSIPPPPREIDMEEGAIPTEARQSNPVAMSDEDARQRVRQRQLLSLDLSVIPGVKIVSDGLQTQVEIETALLFTDKTGGLREEGIPILDRVSAWLKTFGQQPVFIHCYPEELLDTSTGGSSLFLHRYAQLYGFFVDERKMPAARFINTETVKPQEGKNSVNLSTSSGHIVIGSIGGAPLNADSSGPAPKWLEFSITSSRQSFNPEDGDWASIDLAALARKGLRNWSFRILNSASHDILNLQGKGNVLKRISWDGRDEKSGSFLASGSYICRLQATDSEGSNQSHDLVLQIQRAGSSQPAARTPKTTTIKHPKAISKPNPAPGSRPVKAIPTPMVPKVPSLPAAAVPAAPPAVQAPVAEAPAADTTDTADAAGSSDSSSAIWKQVIQFDLNESDLKPTLKASLERIGKTLEVYPLQKVRITGFADATEQNALNLAKQRAAIVRDTLVNEYQVSAKRVINAGGKTGAASGGRTMMKVEISITN